MPVALATRILLLIAATYLPYFVVTSSCKGTRVSNKVLLQNSGDYEINNPRALSDP